MSAADKPASPADRRFAAVQDLMSRYLDPAQDYEVRAGTKRADVAAAIDTLRPLGRTDHWAAALDKWCAWILDEECDLRWAIVQGATGASYAAQ